MWSSNDPGDDVDLCACVVHDKKDDEYYVFLTTDTSKTAKQIINTYELRPEIEEDYRQIKDFWKLEDFKSTKYNFIVFHIVMTLIGYAYFQLFKNLEMEISIQASPSLCLLRIIKKISKSPL